jgi:hypothetical protein
MPRVRWFIAGAAAAAGALVAAPKAYERLRGAIGRDDDVPAIAEAPPPVPVEPAKPRPAAAIAQFDVERSSELRQRIDETRARIHQKTAPRAVAEDDEPVEDDVTEDLTGED